MPGRKIAIGPGNLKEHHLLAFSAAGKGDLPSNTSALDLDNLPLSYSHSDGLRKAS